MTDTKPSAHVTPAEFDRMLAEQAPPITDEQAEAAARILATGSARPARLRERPLTATADPLSLSETAPA